MPFIIDYTKALKRISIVLAILSLLLAILPMPVVAHGAEHVEEDQHTEQTKYVYITEQGDNLTLLVRKSLQLYSNLTRAQVIYAETNIAQDLGSKVLDIDQRVRIPFELLEKYSQRAKKLNSQVLAAWQSYVPYTNFNLRGIRPLEFRSKTKVNTEPTQQPVGPSTSTDSGSPWVWVVGSLAIVIWARWWFRGSDVVEG